VRPSDRPTAYKLAPTRGEELDGGREHPQPLGDGQDGDCFWHSPATTEEVAEARRLGGANRRKKRVVAAAYGLRGLRTIEDIQGALETVTIETFALENSASRNKAIAGMLATGGLSTDREDAATRGPDGTVPETEPSSRRPVVSSALVPQYRAEGRDAVATAPSRLR
jgi:hypothetical protein